MIPKQKFPVLRNLMLFQLGTLLLGTGVLFLICLSTARDRTNASAHLSRRQLEPHLLEVQEEWRTWKALGQQGVLDEEMAKLSAEFPMWQFQVVPSASASSSPDPRSLVVPAPGTEPFAADWVVVAKLDVSKMKSDSVFSVMDIYGPGGLAILFLLVLLISARYIQSRIYRPLLAFVAAFSNENRGREFDPSQIQASGEIRKFLFDVKQLHDRARELERQATVQNIALQVAHDIRSPLAALNSVLARLPQLSPELSHLAHSATQRIRDIADNLLQAEGTQPAPQGTSFLQMTTILQNVLAEKQMLFGEGSRLQLELPREAPGPETFSSCSLQDLGSIVSNLLNNAHEATQGQGNTAVLLSQDPNGWLRITVEDSGCGMAPEQVEAIGTKGTSFGKSGVESGNGLGLYFALKHIHRCQGVLEVSTALGVGTAISILWPPRSQA